MISGTGHRVYIDEEVLLPNDSLKIRNHSPTGFGWGYGGSGPSQLALAILLRFASKEYATRHYQDFKFDVIAGLPQEHFTIEDKAVTDWIEAHP